MKKLMIAAALGAAVLAAPATAATTIASSLGASGTRTFTFTTTGGPASIFVDGNYSGGPSCDGPPGLCDPEIFVFENNLAGALVGNDDDSGGNLDARLSFGNLAAGTYIASVGTFNFTEAEARADSANFFPGELDFSITFSDGLNVQNGAIPEPATWLMMILGFGAIGGVLRRTIRQSEVRFTDKVRRIAAGEAA